MDICFLSSFTLVINDVKAVFIDDISFFVNSCLLVYVVALLEIVGGVIWNLTAYADVVKSVFISVVIRFTMSLILVSNSFLCVLYYNSLVLINSLVEIF